MFFRTSFVPIDEVLPVPAIPIDLGTKTIATTTSDAATSDPFACIYSYRLLSLLGVLSQCRPPSPLSPFLSHRCPFTVQRTLR